jgi:quinol monooxygenase YgiN
MSKSYYPELDRATFALTVHFRAKAEHREALRAKLVERVAVARHDDAVVDFRLFTAEDPQSFTVFESFPSREAWTRFAKVPETSAFLESIAHMLESPYTVARLELVR